MMFFLFLFEPQGAKEELSFRAWNCVKRSCGKIARRKCKYVFVMGDERRRMPFFTWNLFHGKA
jgi:hypothetical protein